MSVTISRMLKGVHAPGVCGSNSTCFAAIESLPSDTDFHVLNGTLCGRSTVFEPLRPKTRMLSSDVLSYIMARFLVAKDTYTSYILLLRERMHLPPCVTSMISSSSSTLVLTVMPENEKYIITSYFNGTKNIVIRNSFKGLMKLVSSVNSGRSSMYIAYPEITDVYMNLLNGLDECSWLVPCFKNKVYISARGQQYYDHHAFPWSRQSQYRGYTIGTDKIQMGSYRQQNLYISSFGYYESFISCAPYKGTCPDCYEMSRVAGYISSILDKTHNVSVPREMRPRSIEALDSMKELLQRALAADTN